MIIRNYCSPHSTAHQSVFISISVICDQTHPVAEISFSKNELTHQIY